MKLKFAFLGLVLLSVMGCEKTTRSDDVLSLSRETYSGDDLRLDGYYYTEMENFEGSYYHRYALFRNGVIRDLGASYELDSPKFLHGKSKTHWGVFEINGANIKFERWYPSSGGPLKAYVSSGEILNDTTFHITESYRIKDGEKTEVRERNEIYHFLEFSPKPDSTNSFID